MHYEAVIGLEVHVQLATATKLFCGCRNVFTLEPNCHVCPVCLGTPGSLPVLNRRAFELALKAALALGCEIPPLTKFDRKHYYYPDLPKNYQISQYDLPLSRNGALEIHVEGQVKKIRILRAHLEEDAGKLIHHRGMTAIDLNRTGTPLLEIVSAPDLRTPQEAKAYLELLKQTLLYTEVSDCNMEEGSLRCDANVSIRPVGESRLGVKNEIKNMNSFKAVESALTLVIRELVRQAEAGETIRQVTWGYSLEKDRIFPLRSKEEANDYRYFPDPDLPPVYVSREWVESIRATLPELPRTKEMRLMSQYSLSEYDASVLAQEREVADYFEALAKSSGLPKESANWVINDILREKNERGIAMRDFPVRPEVLAEILALVREKTINMPTARKLFNRYLEGEGTPPRQLVEKEGLAQVSDTSAIQKALEEAIRENPKAAEDIAKGKTATAGFFFGAVMRALQGQADPNVVGEVIATRFGLDPAVLRQKKKK